MAKLLLLIILCFLTVLVQPALAQDAALPAACDTTFNDPASMGYKIDYDGDGLIELCYLEDLDAVRYQLDGSGYTTSTDAMKNTAGCPTAGCVGYELVRDLDFDDAASYRSAEINTAWTSGRGWQSIGRVTSSCNLGGNACFRGKFHGNGQTLSNLKINRPDDRGVGLFAGVLDGEIDGVILFNADVVGRREVGSLVGQLLLGRISNSAAICRVSGYRLVGGLVGLNNKLIINSFMFGEVVGLWKASDTFTSHSNYLGGLVGESNRFGEFAMQNNYAIARVTPGLPHNVTDDVYIGGLAGVNRALSENLYAVGSVVAIDALNRVWLGGLEGSSNAITNSYAASKVIGQANRAGGLTGPGGVNIVNSYWDATVSGIAGYHRGGDATSFGTSKTTAELQVLKTESNLYANWDDAAWEFRNGAYPLLKYIAGSEGNPVCSTATTPSVLPRCGTRIIGQTAGLRDLVVGPEWQLEPEFERAGLHYELPVDLDSSEIEIQATAYDSSATLSIVVAAGVATLLRNAATQRIALPNNDEILVRVRVETDIPIEYRITVRRVPSSDTRLQTLRLSGSGVDDVVLEPAFAADTTQYKAEIGGADRDIVVTAIAQHEGATIAVFKDATAVAADNGNYALELQADAVTTLTLVVTAQDGTTTQHYVLAVTHRTTPAAQLNSIELSNGITLTPPFNRSITRYTATVGNIRAISVTATAQRGVAISVNGDTVMSGMASSPIVLDQATTTTITITATSGDDATEYTLVLVRQFGTLVELTQMQLLDDASPITLNPSFDSETTTYTATVTNINTLTLAVAASPGATIAVFKDATTVAADNGNYAVELRADAVTTLTLIVTSQDGTTMHRYILAVTHRTTPAAQINSIELSNGLTLTPPFNRSITRYTATVGNISAISVTATAPRGVVVSVNGDVVMSGVASSPIVLNQAAATTITIVATSDDDATTYTIVIRQQPGTSAALTRLQLLDGTSPIALSPSFDPETTTYTATIADIDTLTLEVAPSPGATITVSVNGDEIRPASADRYAIALQPSAATTITIALRSADGLATQDYIVTLFSTPRHPPTDAFRVRSRLFLEAPL